MKKSLQNALMLVLLLSASITAAAQISCTEKEVYNMLDTAKYEKYVNEDYGYSVTLPTNFLLYPNIDGDLSSLLLDLCDLVVISLDATDINLETQTPFNQMNARLNEHIKNGDQIIYSKFLEDRHTYVMSGNQKHGIMFYEKIIFNEKYKLTLKITYKRELKSVVQRIIVNSADIKFLK